MTIIIIIIIIITVVMTQCQVIGRPCAAVVLYVSSSLTLKEQLKRFVPLLYQATPLFNSLTLQVQFNLRNCSLF